MDTKQKIDLFSDYILASTGLVTCTGISQMLNNTISHDIFTNLLSEDEFTQKDFWEYSKVIVRQIEDESGCIIVDDTIHEKPYTDESDLVCWHFDHKTGKSIKGINFLSFIYQSFKGESLINYELVKKTKKIEDKKTGKIKKKSEKTKNEMAMERLQIIRGLNCVKFKYVLADVWFSSKDNMNFIAQNLGKSFVIPLKSNRKVALSLENKNRGKYENISEINFEPETTKEVYLEGVIFPIKILKQVFKNRDGSEGIQYLATNEISLEYLEITTIYKRRWKVEEFHKSSKQNLNVERSPQKKVKTQANYIFMAMVGYLKLVRISMAEKINHFAMKSKIYLKGLRIMFEEVKRLQLCLGSS